jgi:hypothetical protein
MPRKLERPHERHESQLLIQHAFELARTLGIHQLLAQTDECQDIEMIAGLLSAERIIWGMKDHATFTEVKATHDVVVHIPETSLTQMSQMRLTLFLAVLNSDVELNERLVCLAKIAGSSHLDTLFITNLRMFVYL